MPTRVVLAPQPKLGFASPAVPKLVELLASKDRNRVFNAMGALRNIGSAAKAAVPTLRRLATESDDTDVRKSAVRALSAIEEK